MPMLHFTKYQALGNDYLVVDGEAWNDVLIPDLIRRVCHRNYGIGADGMLVRIPQPNGDFRVQIWNPDGTEAEKSGNGLRIFARYLWDQHDVDGQPFTVFTKGGTVRCQVARQGESVTVDMGWISFLSTQIPVAGPEREVLRETMFVRGNELEYSAATIGNPHCILLRDRVHADEARELGPMIERDPRFPHRTNVQFVQILDRHNVAIEIWERGAGYTLASGSSSCAVAGVVVRLGLCDSPVVVHMPGGALTIVIDQQFQVRMTGPVGKVAAGTLAEEMWEGSTRPREPGELSLIRFCPSDAATTLSWIADAKDAASWAGVVDGRLDTSCFARWHTDPDVHAWVLVREGEPVGYGEVWAGFASDAVELARVLISPAHRGRGLGRILLDKLCETTPAQVKAAFLRVRPDNDPAIRCYEGARFQHVSPEQRARYNDGQPVDYLWLSRTIDRGGECTC